MKKKKQQSWFEKTRPKQLIQFTNIKAKIENYADVLPLAAAKVTRLLLICDTFIAVYNYVEQSRATTESLTDWQDLIFKAKGGTQGEPAPNPPAFQTLALPAGAFTGIFEEFQELVADIKRCDNYTRGIGEDLMIVAATGEEKEEAGLVPDLKLKTSAGSYAADISGSMQGVKILKVEYLKKGANIPQTFFLDKLPAVINIFPSQSGEPESGQIRAIFFENNKETGKWSPNYTLTVG